MTMNDSQLTTIETVKEFLNKNNKVQFKHQNKAQTYAWIQDTLVKFTYIKLSKANKGILKNICSFDERLLSRSNHPPDQSIP